MMIRTGSVTVTYIQLMYNARKFLCILTPIEIPGSFEEIMHEALMDIMIEKL